MKIILDVPPVTADVLDEVSPEFLQGMVNAMAQSRLKYGRVAEGFPKNIDAVESLRLRLAKYVETGNRELLRDVANFAMIEFMHPRHAHAHYDDESKESYHTGRVTTTGHVTGEANNPSSELRRQGKSFYTHEGD